tara:strand:- start:1171 stop:1725 length:555 start_codon:yes stop_codon:yes gene_type:complete
MPTVTLSELKKKVSRSDKRKGVPKCVQARREIFGNFNKVRKLSKRETEKPVKYNNSPRSNYNRVVSQIKTNSFRKKYDSAGSIGLIKDSKLTEVKMKQRFPVFPTSRKGREGQSLTNEEREKKCISKRDEYITERNQFLEKGHSLDDWLFGTEMRPVDLDLEIPDDIPEVDEWDAEIDLEEIDC